MIRYVLVVACAAGCQKATSTPTSAVEPDSCAALFRAINDASAGAAREACVADSWSKAAIACAGPHRAPEVAAMCASVLSDNQRDHLTYRIGVAEHRTPGWACEALQKRVTPMLACPHLTEESTLFLKEISAAAGEMVTLFSQGGRNEQQLRTDELRCISIRGQLETKVHGADCPS